METDGQVAKARSAPPESGPEGSERKRAAGKRRRRWKAALGIGALLALPLGGAWLLSENLEQPWIKSRLVALVKRQAGVEIDYSGLELHFPHGLPLSQLRVLSLPSFAEQDGTTLVGH